MYKYYINIINKTAKRLYDVEGAGERKKGETLSMEGLRNRIFTYNCESPLSCPWKGCGEPVKRPTSLSRRGYDSMTESSLLSNFFLVLYLKSTKRIPPGDLFFWTPSRPSSQCNSLSCQRKPCQYQLSRPVRLFSLLAFVAHDYPGEKESWIESQRSNRISIMWPMPHHFISTYSWGWVAHFS